MDEEKKSFIVIDRKMLKWEWYQDSNTKNLFLHLLLIANWENKKWKGIDVERGSLITSIKHLSEQTGLTFQQIRTSLNKLISTNEITKKTTNKYTVITIENYNKYQNYNKQNNKRATNEQQTNNNQITTTKQYNNITNKQLYSCCCYAEEIFGRTLNSPEVKLISDWLEQYNEGLIREAIRLTVVNGKKYLNYTTGILHNWENKGYTSVDDVIKNEKEQKEPIEVFSMDWLNEE